MITFSLSTTMYRCELGYNGEIGTCRKCHQHGKQLRDGLCLACRQAEQRRNPAPRPASQPASERLSVPRFCPDCGRELTGHQQRCAPCSRFRHDEQRRASAQRRGR